MSLPNKIAHLPEGERPRERLLQRGSEALSTIELVAILLGCGTKETPVIQLAENLLVHFGSLQKLAEASVTELCQVKGIGRAKAIQLKAALALGARSLRASHIAKSKVFLPQHVFQLVRDALVHETREFFLVILQDIKLQMICHEVISIGTLSKTLVHPREVFYPAIRHKAASMILVHNHPSGDLTPSEQDIKITQTLVQVGNLLSIPVSDHIIVAATGYISLRDFGVSFD